MLLPLVLTVLAAHQAAATQLETARQVEEEAKKTWSCEFCKKEFKPDRIRTTLVGQHMRDEHDLPEYNCLEVKVESNKLVTNQAKQNFQLMLSKMLGGKS